MRKGRKYLCFTPSTPYEVATEAFTKKYGTPPDEVGTAYNLVFTGPIDEDIERGWQTIQRDVSK